MESQSFSSQILGHLTLSPQDTQELITVQVFKKEILEVSRESQAMGDLYIGYVVYVTRVDILNIEKIWIDQCEYSLDVKIQKSVNFKTPPIKFEVGTQGPCLGVLDTEGRILLLRINGDFHGSIQQKKYKFTSFAFWDRYIYIGTNNCSILAYDLGKLRFTDTKYDLEPKYAPSYKTCSVIDIQINTKKKLLYYTLSDMTKRYLDLTEKARRVPEDTRLQKYKEKIRVIHCLSQDPEGLDQDLDFLTISKYGKMQKFHKSEDGIRSKIFYLLQDPGFISQKFTQISTNDRVTCSHLEKVTFQGKIYDNLYVGTQNGFLLKFSCNDESIQYINLVNNGPISQIEIHSSNNMRTLETFVFLRCEDEHHKGVNIIKILKESPDDLNGTKEIHQLTTINTKRFKLFSDMTNDWYMLIQGQDGDYYQMNAFLVLSKYLKVKQIDIQFQNEEPELLEEMQVDPRIREQVLETFKFNKDLYEKHILDFIEITIYSDPFSLCKFRNLFWNLDDKDPNVYYDLEGFTKIRDVRFSRNKSLIFVYGVCKQDHYQKESLQNLNSNRKQTQTWAASPRNLESSPCILLLSTKTGAVVSFIQNVSDNLTQFCLSQELDLFNYDSSQQDQEYSDKVKANGCIVALNVDGNTEIIEIDNDPKTKLKRIQNKNFRISQKKTKRQSLRPQTSRGQFSTLSLKNTKVISPFMIEKPEENQSE